MVEAIGLYKSFGSVEAVRGVSFSVSRGEIFGLLGPNGAGKTTTIRMITGLLRPDRGRAFIMGIDVHRDPIEARSHIGVVPEVSNPYVDLSVWDNLVLIGKLYCIPKETIIERGKSLLEELGLYDRRSSKAKTLSKGMRRRLLLAMALISDPEILFLDEPTSGLDVFSARKIRSMITGLRRNGKTIVLTTHNIDEAGMLCDRVAIINKGKIIAEGTPDDLRIRYGKYIEIKVLFDNSIDSSVLNEFRDHYNVTCDERWVTIICEKNELDEVLDKIMNIKHRLDLRIKDLHIESQSFEDIFVRIVRGE